MVAFGYTATGKPLEKMQANLQLTGNLQVDGSTTFSTYGAPVFVQRVKFLVASGGAAGTHTGSVSIPAAALLIDVIVHAVALWNTGTTAVLKVGDVADDDGIFTDVNVRGTDLVAGESISFAHSGAQQGADVDVPAADAVIRRRYLATARVVTGVITLVGTAATTGETYMDVVYSLPSSADITTATFVAT